MATGTVSSRHYATLATRAQQDSLHELARRDVNTGAAVVGADHDVRFRSVVTSYDYDAPLTEAGDPTEKLLLIRDVIKQVPSPW